MRRSMAWMNVGVLFVLALAASGAVIAQTTAYVTNDLEITMRSGQGNDYRIIRLLTAGAEVEVLERGDEWTRVAASGDTGWVRSLYLQSQPGAVERLSQANAQIERLRGDNRQLEQALSESQTALDTLKQTADALEADNQRMQERLQEADEGLTLADDNQALRKQVIDLERQIADLQRENEAMSTRGQQNWFLAGAGVIIAGMLLGIILTRIRWRRRGSWGDL
ncbi:MAG: TIGR04211 family SH3 domain-containing protein [Spiribacter sp.]|nr:TIGR04211 family SH3 domain-containing protein [Spiribacter sp.]